MNIIPWKDAGLAKSLARRPGATVFSSRATKCITALPDGLPPRRFLKTPKVSCIKLKAIKSFKYVKWYKNVIIFQEFYSWGQKDKSHDTGFNSKGNDVIE